MSFPQHPDYDPPSYGGTPQQEANEEMKQIFGMENPDKQWVLTDYDVWERNPFYSGPEQQHPEDDTPHEEWKPFNPKFEDANEEMHEFLLGCDECPF